MKNLQIFLSFKFHDQQGQPLPDYYMAKELYEALTQDGFECFFSDETILQSGRSDYSLLIDQYLEKTDLMIVVSTSPEHCNSPWVHYEWHTYSTDVLNKKRKGELISYLDASDVQAFPLRLRTNQVFEKNNNGIENILKFANNLNKHRINGKGDNADGNHSVLSAPAEGAHKKTGSSYNYDVSYGDVTNDLDNERSRLVIQGKVAGEKDYGFILDLLPHREEVYTVLDVGCSMGSMTLRVFGRFGESVRVLGVDKFQTCVDGFNQDCPANMHAELLDFDVAGWESQLSAYMKAYGIDGFDLVYCALSLHHMADSEAVIKKLWKFIRNNGYIYIRTVDDALKIAYPECDLVYDVIRRTDNLPNASDRFHGRKVYTMLYKASYKNIQTRAYLIDTAGMSMDERHELFYTAFVWRQSYFKWKLDHASTPKEQDEADKEYKEIVELLAKVEDLFANQSFYFGYYATVAIGQKCRNS